MKRMDRQKYYGTITDDYVKSNHGHSKEWTDMKLEKRDIKVGIMNCLKVIRGASFEQSEDLITGGYIDSFGLLFLVEELEKFFHVKIPLASIEPERFNKVDGICELIEECMK